MVSILLAAYNGEKYIKEQLDSLFAQSVQDFIIYVLDDASADSTVSILNEYAQRYPGRIEILQNVKNSGSPKHAFLNLMQNIKTEYIMLCDQDDVWHLNKIEVSINKIKELESDYGKHTPLLVFSDLTVVDSSLKQIYPSFKEMMNSDYTKTGFNTLLVQNVLTGCTAMYNKALTEYLKQIPEYCVMHDWWLILTASAFGKIGVIEGQTLLYRQHGKNIVGANDVKKIKYKIKRLIGYKRVKQALAETYQQAECFYSIFGDKLPEHNKKMLKAYIMVPRKNKVYRWYVICKYGIMKIGITRRVAHFLFI